MHALLKGALLAVVCISEGYALTINQKTVTGMDDSQEISELEQKIETMKGQFKNDQELKLSQIETDTAQGQSQSIEADVDAQASADAENFFFVDDFFHWLGCKFVNCNKTIKEKKPQTPPPPI